MLVFGLVIFSLIFLGLCYLTLMAYRFITKGPDFIQLEISGSAGELIQLLVSEIKTALSLNQTEVIHKFNSAEPPIDGEVAASVVFMVSQTLPCAVVFNYQPNHDVRIVLQPLT